MASQTTFPIRLLGAALYLVAGLVLVDQVSELLVSLRPWDLGRPHWRFGAFGLITGRATILVLLDAMVIAGAGLRGNVLLLRAWAVVHLVAGLALAAAIVLFALDTVQIRGTVTPAAIGGFQAQAARAALTSSLLVLFCLGFGVAALVAGRRRGGDSQVVIVVPNRDG